GDGDEVGLELAQRARRREQLLGRLLALRREELDREERSLGAEDVVDAHPLRVASAGLRGGLAPVAPALEDRLDVLEPLALRLRHQLPAEDQGEDADPA